MYWGFLLLISLRKLTTRRFCNCSTCQGEFANIELIFLYSRYCMLKTNYGIVGFLAWNRKIKLWYKINNGFIEQQHVGKI